MIRLDSYSRQVFIYLDPILIYISLWIDCLFEIRKIAVCFLWLSVAAWIQGHWWGFISRNYVVWATFFLMNVFIALKGFHFWFYIRSPSCFQIVHVLFGEASFKMTLHKAEKLSKLLTVEGTIGDRTFINTCTCSWTRYQGNHYHDASTSRRYQGALIYAYMYIHQGMDRNGIWRCCLLQYKVTTIYSRNTKIKKIFPKSLGFPDQRPLGTFKRP